MKKENQTVEKLYEAITDIPEEIIKMAEEYPLKKKPIRKSGWR